jgi:hypothetical protein
MKFAVLFEQGPTSVGAAGTGPSGLLRGRREP